MTEPQAAPRPQVGQVVAELVAVITAVDEGVPLVLTTADRTRLPSGPFQPQHQSMQAGLRAWVEQQTGYELGYVEQLYTFADRTRGAGPVLEISYLGLTTAAQAAGGWRSWLDFFPWEDHRRGAALIDGVIAPHLHRWSGDEGSGQRDSRWLRSTVTFGLDGQPWLANMTLQRYELLYEVGLVPESPWAGATLVPGEPMERHHRRILATGIGRLRAKIEYRPVVFELLPEAFTLGQLQTTVETIAGQHLHKQNFRRLVEQQELVEETGELERGTGGRPAKLFRFRRRVLDERAAAGTKLPLSRAR